MNQSGEHDLGNFSDLDNGELTACEAGDLEILVCRVDGRLYAIEDKCSHADTPLSEGRLSGFQVNCPLHGASFDVRDGTHSGPPAYTGVRCFEIVEGDSGVTVTIENDKPEAEDGPQTGFFQTR